MAGHHHSICIFLFLFSSFRCKFRTFWNETSFGNLATIITTNTKINKWKEKTAKIVYARNKNGIECRSIFVLGVCARAYRFQNTKCVACSVSDSEYFFSFFFSLVLFLFSYSINLVGLMLDTGFQNHSIPNKTKVNAFD